MTYKLQFLPSAFREWEKLDRSIQSQLKNKLAERLTTPHVPASSLSGFENHYKIKLRSSGFRLVYEVLESEIVVLVIAIGKREKSTVYKKVQKRQKKD
jgi:mRNA interferase RelE/StbE